MIRFILTTVFIFKNTEAIKFVEDPLKSPTAIMEETKTNLESIESLDDVDGRILTGTRHVRRKKHYAHSASENNVKKVNHNGDIHDKATSGNVQESGEHYENGGIAPNRFGGDDRFASVENEDANNGFSGNIQQTNFNNDGSFDGESFQASNEDGFHGMKNGVSNKDSFHTHNGEFSDKDNFRGTKNGPPSEDTFQGTSSNGEAGSVLEQCIRDDSVGILPCISQKTVNFLERYSHSAKDINIEENLILSSNPADEHQSSRLIPVGE